MLPCQNAINFAWMVQRPFYYQCHFSVNYHHIFHVWCLSHASYTLSLTYALAQYHLWSWGKNSIAKPCAKFDTRFGNTNFKSLACLLRISSGVVWQANCKIKWLSCQDEGHQMLEEIVLRLKFFAANVLLYYQVSTIHIMIPYLLVFSKVKQ